MEDRCSVNIHRIDREIYVHRICSEDLGTYAAT